MKSYVSFWRTLTASPLPVRWGGGLWLAAVLAVLLAGLGCSSSVGIFNKVQPRTIDAVARDGFVDGNYVVWVDCIIKNEGDSGEVEVKANLSPISGGNWVKGQRVYMKGGVEETISFEFLQAFELHPDLSHYFPSCGAWSPTAF